MSSNNLISHPTNTFQQQQKHFQQSQQDSPPTHMEIPCKHDKKKNLKNLPKAINVGLGIGGVVFVGGALVTAAIVSGFAFRSKSQRRSSLENTKKKNMQQSVDDPNMLELVIKTDIDFSPSEEVTSMNEIKTNISQSVTTDKKHDEQVHSGDSNEDKINSVANENQENTSIRVDSAFASEEQVVMAVKIEKDSCLEGNDDDGGGEELKHLMLIDNENEENVDANSLVSNEGVVSIEEYEAVDVPIIVTVVNGSKNDDVIEDSEDCISHVNVEDNLHDEIIMENCGDLSDETGYAEEVDDAARLLRAQLLDGQDEIILENCEEDLSNKKGVADQILKETDQRMECSNKQVVVDHEVEPGAQDMQVNKSCETFVVACVMNQVKEAVGDQTVVNEDTPLSRLINNEEKDKGTAQKVEEHVTIEDEAAKVEVTTEHELVNNDEIPHVEFVKEDEESEEDVTTKPELSCSVNPSSVNEEPTPEAKINNHKIEETNVQVKGRISTNHALIKKDEIPHVESIKEDEDSEKDVTVKVELSSGVSSSSMQEELTPEAKISNHEIEENMEENQTTFGKNHKYDEEDVTLKANLSSGVSSTYVLEEPTLEAKISNHNNEENTEENQTLLGENHNNSEEDVTTKAEPSSGVNSSTMQEEPTPETKISNHKIEENMEENQAILGKNDYDNNDNGDIKIKEQAFARGPWNLKLMAWSALISIWCLCHWYSELPFLKLSLVGSLLFILILFGYRNRATHLVKYE